MKFVIFRSTKNRQYYWRLVAANGRTVTQSEGYHRKDSCLKCIAAVKKSATAKIVFDPSC